ncbi:MAG TPA: DUF6132 family protein [Bacteroidales bacterium]|nr:DUF6132 family protein [Bacteroidales bacterium]
MENTTDKNKSGIFSKIPVISLIGLLVGAAGGYLYYHEVGCVSGTCAITSNPWMSTLWGAALGYLIFDMFRGKKVKTSADHSGEQKPADLD